MPELPEVETTCRGIKPYLLNQKVSSVTLRQTKLRWPISSQLKSQLTSATILSLRRRGKYLLMETTTGTAIWHLGMSGSLRLVEPSEHPGKHDHVDWRLANGWVLRYCDPRRFGSLHWTRRDPYQHKLIKVLGVEPLGSELTGAYLFEQSRGRRVAVKNFIMNSHVVVGVGNIYANESLYEAGIDPRRQAGRVAQSRYEQLVVAIKQILATAIQQGGTTLRDFVGGDGKPGYFKQQLKVYGRGGLACGACGQQLNEVQLGQRATVFCNFCQT